MDPNFEVHVSSQHAQLPQSDSQQPQCLTVQQQQQPSSVLPNRPIQSFQSFTSQQPQLPQSDSQQPSYSQSNSVNGSNNILNFYENLRSDNSLGNNFMNDLFASQDFPTSEYEFLMKKYHKILEETPIDDPFIKSSIVELIEAVRSKILSALQVRILLSKIKGASHQENVDAFGLSSKTIARKVIFRTVCGRKWDRDYKGGGEKVLSELDEEIFIKNVEDRANDIDCISTHVAHMLVYHLQESRCKKARALLLFCKCKKMAGKIKIRKPTSTWMNKAAERMGIKIIPKQDIARERRMACDKIVINQFFDLHSELLNREPELIFNMDETMISSKRKFKVLCPKGLRGLSVADEVYPHMTACVTIGAAGHVMKPLFILPNKKKLGDLEEFKNNAHFASSPSGWMNKKIFTFWAMCFVTEIMVYRFNLPENLRKKRILLILDGHKSRANFMVAKMLDFFGIDILVLPGHTSHLLQPFDVSVASSLKTEYKKLLMEYKISFNAGDNMLQVKQKMKMGEVRRMMIICMLDAIRKSATLSNIMKGFQIIGLVPVDRSIPLSSSYAMPDVEKICNIRHIESVNNRCLNNSKENLVYVYKLDFHAEPRESELLFDFKDLFDSIKLSHVKNNDGWALSNIPDIAVQTGSNDYQLLQIDGR